MSLLIFAVLFLAAWGLGEGVLRVTRSHNAIRRAFSRPGPAFVRWALGVGTLGLVGMLGAWAGILPRPAAIAVAIAAAAAGIAILPRTWRDLAVEGFNRRSPVDLVGLAACGVATLYNLRLAWSPQLQFDDIAYHVTMPRQYLFAGRMFAVPYDLHPHLHCLWEMAAYFGYAFSSMDFITPKLFQIAAMLGIAGLLIGELRRWGFNGAGWTMAVWWLMMQECVEFAPTAQIELALAFELLLGFLLLAKALAAGRADRTRMLLLGGLVFGFANGTKNNAMIFSSVAAILAAFGLALRSCRIGGRAWFLFAQQAALAGGVGLLITAPWLIKNAAFTGNPFYPFLIGVFPTRVEYEQVARDFLHSYGNFESAAPSIGARAVATVQHFMFMLRTAPVVDQFRVFAFFLIAGMCWLGRLRRERDTALHYLHVAAFVMAPFVLVSPARRFVLGTMALYFLLIGAGLGRLLVGFFRTRPRIAWISCIAAILFFLPGQLDRTTSAGARMHETGREWRIRPLLAARAFGEYFEEQPNRDWAALLIREVGPEGRLLTTENAYVNAWMPIRLIPTPNIHGRKILQLMAEDEGRSPDEIAAFLHALGITHVFTSQSFDTSPALQEFREQWLVVVSEQKGLCLYLLRYNRNNHNN